MRSHPEIAVDVSGDYTSDIEKLTQSMVSDTGAYDVLLMNLSYMPVERLIEKGYCADLSQSAEIMEEVSAMYQMCIRDRPGRMRFRFWGRRNIKT